MFKMLTIVLVVASLLGTTVPSKAQEITWCDAVYTEIVGGVHWMWVNPVGCIYHNGTQAIPLREAPVWADPWVAGEGALVHGEAVWPPSVDENLCMVPVGQTITLPNDTRIYYAPDARAGTPYVIPGGSTAQQIQVSADGAFQQVVWACDTVWVPR